MIEKGSWVRIKRTVLESSLRAERLPEETRKVPFVMWVKGSLLNEGRVGETVTVRTKSGRIEEGELLEVNPAYDLNYGKYVEQLRHIGEEAREILFGQEEQK